MINLYIFDQTSHAAVFGIGTYIRELITALKNSNVNVCVVHLRSEKPDGELMESDNIRHLYIPPPINRNISSDQDRQNKLYYRNIVYLLRLQMNDAKRIVFHLNYNNSGKLAEELKNVFNCRIVAVSHFSKWSFTIFDNLPRLRKILNEEHSDKINDGIKRSFEEEKYYYSKADCVICLSNYMQEILYRDYGLDATKISVIPNGLEDNGELKIENGELSVKSALRKKWNILHTEKVILYAGRIDEAKGVRFLIKAFREVLEKFPDCRLIIVGSGDYDMLFEEAKDICTKISFTGLLKKQNLHEFYQIADVGVIPSLFESFGYVAVEMMMYGLPIVATATSGLNEVVDDTCGLKVPVIQYPDKVEIDIDLLAGKILYLLQHPQVTCKLGKNSRKRYEKMYTSEVFGQKMLRLYQSLIEQ